MKNKDYINEEIKDKFRITDSMIKIDEKRKKDTFLLLQKNIDKKQFRVLNSRKGILLNQLRYMDKSMTVIHLVLCVVLISITYVMKMYGVERADIILFSMLLSGILAVVSILEISRIFSSGIAEISESCYFNVKQIVAFQMLISGIINLMLFSIEILLAGYGWKIELVHIALYILVPFVFTECVCLGVLLMEAGRKKSYLLVMAGTFTMALFFVLSLSPKLYKATAIVVWGAAFVAGLFILCLQIKILFSGIKKGEIICTN